MISNNKNPLNWKINWLTLELYITSSSISSPKVYKIIAIVYSITERNRIQFKNTLLEVKILKLLYFKLYIRDLSIFSFPIKKKKKSTITKQLANRCKKKG